MKKPFLSLILCLLFAASFAQDYTQPKDTSSDEEIKTLFKKPKHEKKDISVGWTAGLNSAYTQFDKQNVWLVGLAAGPILNHNWTIGLQLNAIVNSYYLYYDTVINNTNAYLVGGFGGFLIQYTLFPKSAVHVTFPLQIGGGYLGYLSDNGYNWENGNGYWYNNSEILDYDVFFYVEPGVQAEFNLLKFMRLAVGVSYRYSPNFDLEKTSSGLINQFNGTVGLKFGKF
jgi:hypothetical protein